MLVLCVLRSLFAALVLVVGVFLPLVLGVLITAWFAFMIVSFGLGFGEYGLVLSCVVCFVVYRPCY